MVFILVSFQFFFFFFRFSDSFNDFNDIMNCIFNSERISFSEMLSLGHLTWQTCCQLTLFNLTTKCSLVAFHNFSSLLLPLSQIYVAGNKIVNEEIILKTTQCFCVYLHSVATFLDMGISKSLLA